MSIVLEKGLGYHRDNLDHRDFMYAAPGSVLQNLPTSVDLRAQCPQPYDQQTLGSCTSNAIAAAIEFDQKRQGLPDVRPSRLFVYYNERKMEGTVNSDAGARIRDGIKSVNAIGACPETSWPYDISQFATEPPISCYQEATQQKAVMYQRVLQQLPQMKGCLAAGLPFTFGISVYPSFMTTAVAESGIVPMPGFFEAPIGGHALLCVGFDDALQQFIFQNSWGVTWNPNDAHPGTGYISYGYLTDPFLAADFWVIQSIS